MDGHDHFQSLCVLAASDELSEMEVIALRQHARSCAFCTNQIIEITQLRSQLLLAHALHDGRGRLSAGMRERFITRALAEGVPLTRLSPVISGKLGMASILLASLLLFAAVLNQVVATRSIANTPPLVVARAAPLVRREEARSAKPAIELTGISLPHQAVQRKHRLLGPQQRSLPIYLATFQNRDFSFRLSSPFDAPSRFRFPPPLMLRKSNTLNLFANLQQAENLNSSRKFEFSTSSMSRFVRVNGCDPQ